MIQTIVFDWGKVLAPSDNVIAAKKLAKQYGVDEQSLQKEIERLQFDYAGVNDDNEFCDKIKLKFNIDPEDLKRALNEVPPDDVLDIAKKLKAKGFRVYLLSDQLTFKGEYIKENFDISFFDKVFFSYEIGAIKRDKKPFEIFISDTKENPEECVFIDDNEDNINNAKEFGFNTVLFKNKAQLIKELAGFSIEVD